MSIEVQIVDQRVSKVAEDRRQIFTDILGIKNDEHKLRSAAYVFVVIKSLLDLGEAEALDCMVEGSNDFAIDAIHVAAPRGGEFAVTLVQGKYKLRMDGASAFPETAVVAVLAALSSLFDPDKEVDGNIRLMERLTLIRQLVADGYIPRVVVVLCNNGSRWTASAQRRIDQDPYGKAVTWYHLGPESLLKLLRPVIQIDATLQLSGFAIVESFDFRRALIGRIAVSQLAALFEIHGDRLLDRNIRRYVGLAGNRVNEGIATTLRDAQRRQNFYFYNNGITIICTQFRYNALQQQNWQVQLTGMQIINGGQTCRTIQQVVQELGPEVGTAQVMLRIYELPKEDQDLVYNITFATNSQNPVSLRDLKSNDEKQRLLEQSISELGYKYRRQRSDVPLEPNEFEVETVALSVLVVWRCRRNPPTVQSVLDEFYDQVFTSDLNGAQAVLAVRIYDLEKKYMRQEIEKIDKTANPTDNVKDMSLERLMRARIRPKWLFFYLEREDIPAHMGKLMLSDLGIGLNDIDHTKFKEINQYLTDRGHDLFDRAFEIVRKEQKVRLQGLNFDRIFVGKSANEE